VWFDLVERWILARLRHETVFSLFALKLAIGKLLEQLNRWPFKKLPGCRHSLVEELDHPALMPLPTTPYEYAEWRKCRVHLDYHIEVDRHFYSVLHALVRREIEVRLTAQTVACGFNHKRVAAHVRSHQPGSHATQADHMPKAHGAPMDWTPGRFLT
jgi:hypothetical protein